MANIQTVICQVFSHRIFRFIYSPAVILDFAYHMGHGISTGFATHAGMSLATAMDYIEPHYPQ